MKRSLTLPIAAIGLFLGVLVFNSCQKETKETSNLFKEESGKKKKPPVSTKDCARPVFFNKSIDTHCSEGHSCSMAIIPLKNKNRINWRVGTPCPGNPNYTGTTYYTLYKRNPLPATDYSKITTFSCTNATMWYANSLLTNSSTFILVSNNVSTALPTPIVEDIYGFLYDNLGNPLIYSDSWKFATGTTAGTVNCINKEPIGL
jgi:hypothetical protein